MMRGAFAIAFPNPWILQDLARAFQNQQVVAQMSHDGRSAIVEAAIRYALEGHSGSNGLRRGAQGTRIFRNLVYTFAPAAFADVC